jgi:hypothetical protein
LAELLIGGNQYRDCSGALKVQGERELQRIQRWQCDLVPVLK